MSLPGFTAESSLYQTGEPYLAAMTQTRSGNPHEAVQLAGIFDPGSLQLLFQQLCAAAEDTIGRA